jgi:hypothetical protein
MILAIGQAYLFRNLSHSRTFSPGALIFQGRSRSFPLFPAQPAQFASPSPWKGHSVAKSSPQVEMDRRKSDRRAKDRRKQSTPVAAERRQGERRVKVPRRRQIDPTTCERDYNNEEIEFMQALDAYKRANGRMFPTCSEILEVIRALGYMRVNAPAPAATAEEPAIAEAV